MKKEPKLAAIVLAAGESKRMGGIKQLLAWNQTTLINHTIQTVLNTEIEDVFVVVGAHMDTMIKEIHELKIEVVRNPDWHLGMGSSLAKAMHKIQQFDSNYDGVLIVLIDQPLIDVTCINYLLTSFKENKYKIISSQYNKGAGVPAIFPVKYFNALAKLEGDKGAKKIISEHTKENISLDFKNKIVDIDTEETYRQLFNKYSL